MNHGRFAILGVLLLAFAGLANPRTLAALLAAEGSIPSPAVSVVLWTVAGSLAVVGLLLVVLRNDPTKCLNVVIVAISLFLHLGLFEVAYWGYDRFFPRNRLWHGNAHVVFQPSATSTPGVVDTSRFTTNAQGLRGREPSPEDTHRIACVGGRTTECFAVDDYETWTHLLETNLKRAKLPAWVGNAGISGLSLDSGPVVMQQLMRDLPDIDLMIMLPGVNTMSNDLARLDMGPRDWSRLPGDALRRAQAAFSASATQRLVVWGLDAWGPQPQSTDGPVENRVYAADLYNERRAARARSQLIDELPDLDQQVDAYAAKLRETIQFAQDNNIELLMMTQPTLWHKGMTTREQRLLWFGWTKDPGKYYSAEVLAAAMELYNDALRKVCKERSVLYLDLAREIPRTTSMFYDDCHFNERGCRRVARLVSAFLLRHDLLHTRTALTARPRRNFPH